MRPNANIALTPELRECFKCRFETVIASNQCPRCGRPMYNAHNIRVRGVVLIVVGLFLVCFMAVIAVGVAMLLAGAMKDPASSKRINGEAGMLLAVYGVFALVIAFGLHSIVIGIWQIIFGRRNRILIWLMWALLFVLLAAGGFVRELIA